MSHTFSAQLAGLVDFSQPTLYISALAIAFNPVFWNIVARREYHTKFMTRAFGGNARLACYTLAVTIFGLGLIRDLLYERALRAQPAHPALQALPARAAGCALLAAGNVLVVSSMWALGVTGTYLGDYFGILLDGLVTGFPFNLTDAPMYYGSTMSFLGSALLYGRPAGLLLTVEVLLAYRVAMAFENPFTAEIYAKRDRKRAAAARVSARTGARTINEDERKKEL